MSGRIKEKLPEPSFILKVLPAKRKRCMYSIYIPTAISPVQSFEHHPAGLLYPLLFSIFSKYYYTGNSNVCKFRIAGTSLFAHVILNAVV